MSRMLLFHASCCTLHLIHCTMLCLAHLYSYVPDHAESELVEPTKPAPAEEAANTELIKGKPWCILHISLDFWFQSIIILQFVCVLSL
jgi:hypothetical protein